MNEQERTITTVTKYYEQQWNEWRLEHPNAPLYNSDQYERLLASSQEANFCQSWNQWRKDNYDILVNFRGADFTGTDLRGTDLSRADMRGANLTYVKFEGANLDDAYLKLILMDDITALGHPIFANHLANIWQASGKSFPMRLGIRIVFNR